MPLYSSNRLLLILLDAVSFNYIEGHARYLRKYEYQPIKTMPGYSGTLATALTGVLPAQHGTWNVFRWNPSRFWPLRVFKVYGQISPTIYKLLLKHGRNFEVSLAHPHSHAHAFAVPSVYDLCRERDIRFLYYNHPWWCTNDSERLVLRRYSDRSVVDRVKPVLWDYHFVFVHLYEMDGIGHRYGPAGKTLEYVTELELLVKELIREWRGDVLIFSDHGMNRVTCFVDLSRLVQKEICFLDSTMARFWHPSPDTIASLESLSDGRFMTTDELDKYVPDERYGTHIWCASTGSTILPNFWSGAPVAGMHGYLDETEAVLIGSFELEQTTYEMTEIFPILAKCLDLQ